MPGIREAMMKCQKCGLLVANGATCVSLPLCKCFQFANPAPHAGNNAMPSPWRDVDMSDLLMVQMIVETALEKQKEQIIKAVHSAIHSVPENLRISSDVLINAINKATDWPIKYKEKSSGPEPGKSFEGRGENG